MKVATQSFMIGVSRDQEGLLTFSSNLDQKLSIHALPSVGSVAQCLGQQ